MAFRLHSPAYDQLCDQLERIDSLSRLNHNDPAFAEWKLTIATLLDLHFGRNHDISFGFRNLAFAVIDVGPTMASFDLYERPVSWSPLPERGDDDVFRRDLRTAQAIIKTALAVWDSMPPASALAPATPAVVQINNSNQNTANSSASSEATAEVQFPLGELLNLVELNDTLRAEQKALAKEQLEDLDGELRKANPRWEKVKPALKVLLDTGKEVAIKTLAAVVAKHISG